MRRYVVLFSIGVALYIAQGEFREHLNSTQKQLEKVNAVKVAMPAINDPYREAASLENLAPTKASAIEIADKYLEAHRIEWKLQPYHEFKAVEFKTPISTKVVYSVYQEGVPVLNMGISIQIERDLSIGKVENTYLPIEKAKILEKEKRVSSLIPLVSDRYIVTDDPKMMTLPVIVIPPGGSAPQVAYQLSVADKIKAKEPMEILFRASDGQVLGKSKPRSEF